MTVHQVLNAARAAGVTVKLDGEDLVLSAAAAPPRAVISAIARHKAKIVELLRPDSWSASDWLVFFDERAGIAEFDGGLERSAAETRALECCVVEWLNRNPVSSPPGRCLHCDGSEGTLDELVPFGTEETGHAWLHSRCWAVWHRSRKEMAAAVLSAALSSGKR